MQKYSDENIRNIKKITCKIAGDYLGVSPMFISIGMRQDKLPIGFAIKNNNGGWSYHIIAERLIAYKNGKLPEVLIDGIEDKLNKIIENFDSMKQDLITLLKNQNKWCYAKNCISKNLKKLKVVVVDLLIKVQTNEKMQMKF